MAKQSTIADYGADTSQPTIRQIGVADLFDALAKGFDDFKAMPTHLIFLILIYPIIMLLSGRVAAGYDVLPLVFPLLAGYTLVGPLVAIGMYELSRRREGGHDISRKHLFDVLKSPSFGAIVRLGIVLVIIYFAWLIAALAIFKLTFGGPAAASMGTFFLEVITLELGNAAPDSIGAFASQILTTSAGWKLFVLGSGVGLAFAIVVLALSVVSFPMLLDRKVSARTAARTSVRAFIANPATMIVWGLIVAAALVIGTLPLFVGLAIVMPVLGHASWQLYRKVVEH